MAKSMETMLGTLTTSGVRERAKEAVRDAVATPPREPSR